MALNNYNPLTDTIDIVISAFLSIIILGLFKYFANDKMKKGSPINVFDDIIVLLSFVIYPVINASQWFQYFTALNRSMFISSISEGPFFTLSCYFIWLASFNRDEVSFELMRKVSIYILITVNVILVNIPYLTIITGDLTPEKSLTLNPNDYI
ncbi:21961_t:CDS:1, partial [Gigaspora margarita]